MTAIDLNGKIYIKAGELTVNVVVTSGRKEINIDGLTDGELAKVMHLINAISCKGKVKQPKRKETV